jgi:hypothetical protein
LSAAEKVELVAGPATGAGALVLAASSRLQGTELNTLVTIWADDGISLQGLIGFRYLEVDEGMEIQRYTNALTSADEFDGHNRFYGARSE